MEVKNSLKTPSGIVVLIALILVVGILFWQIDGIKEMFTGLVGTEENAVLSLVSEKNSCYVGEIINIDLKLDSQNQNVVALDAILNYDSDYFALRGVETSNSVFATDNQCSYQGSFCQLVNTQEGEVEIVQAKPTPGVNVSDGLVARLRFRCLKEGEFSEDNFTIDLSNSEVILDSETGEEILSGVNNLKLNIVSATSTPGKFKVLQVEGKKDKPLTFIIRILDPETQKIIKEITRSVSDCDDQEFEVAPAIAAGSYLFKIKAKGYLARKVSLDWPPVQVIELSLLRAGDLNGDGIINELDWSLLHSHWYQAFEDGDFNSDGIINTLDWSFMNRNWGLTEDD